MDYTQSLFEQFGGRLMVVIGVWVLSAITIEFHQIQALQIIQVSFGSRVTPGPY